MFFDKASSQSISSSRDNFHIEKTNDVTYERTPALENKLESNNISTQALGTCDPSDGPYYRNRVKAGLLQYDTDVTLSTSVNVAVVGGGAFVYTGFSSSDGTQQNETGFQWVKNANSTSTDWGLYFRVQGSYSNVTNGQWVNGWYINAYHAPKGATVHINSQIFSSGGYNYIMSTVDYNSSRVVVGIRSDSSVDFSKLVETNENNIWARKIVSLAYSSGGSKTWPASDTSSYVRNAKFDNSTYTRALLKYNWSNYGCTYQKDGFTVYYDPSSLVYGDIASVYK